MSWTFFLLLTLSRTTVLQAEVTLKVFFGHSLLFQSFSIQSLHLNIFFDFLFVKALNSDL